MSETLQPPTQADLQRTRGELARVKVHGTQVRTVVERIHPTGSLVLILLQDDDLGKFTPAVELDVEIISGEAVYQFSSTLERLFTDPNSKEARFRNFLLLAPPENLKKIQRRKFFRVKANLPLRFFVLDDEHASRDLQPLLAALLRPNQEHPVHSAHTTDVSAGGLHVVTALQVPLGKTLLFDINSDELRLQHTAQVMRNIPTGTEYRPVFNLGVMFTELPDRQRDQLTRFLFKEEVKRRGHRR